MPQVSGTYCCVATITGTSVGRTLACSWLSPSRARAAAAISESIGIPPHLSLPPFPSPALHLSQDDQKARRLENGTNDEKTRRKETACA